jgi:hypothetical protein
MMSAVFAVAVASSPALACKGATSLLRDDFTDVDPAWQSYFTDSPSFQIGGGKALLNTPPGNWQVLFYQGDFYPAGDACVTITGPGTAVKDPSALYAGIVLQDGNGDWWMPSVNGDGSASVDRLASAGWLHPVPPRKFDAVKTGANAVNVLRVVWKAPPAQGSNTPPDPNVTVFINDKQFIVFKMAPNANRLFGLGADTEGTNFQFSNLAITK